MTWREFKAAIDNDPKVTDETTIAWIDIGCGQAKYLNIGIGNDGFMEIWGWLT